MDDPISRIEATFSRYQQISLKEGEVLVRAGDPMDSIYMVSSGVVRQYTVTDNGDELTVYLYGKNSCFFLPWCFGLKENQYYFEAVTEVLVWRAPRDLAIREAFGNTDGMQFMFRGMAAGIYGLMVWVETMVYGSAVRKVASVLIILSRWHGILEEDGNIKIHFALPHRLLATMVGMTRETTTTAVGKLKRKGIISCDNSFITIQNLARLEEEAAKYFDGLAEISTHSSVEKSR